MDALDVIHLVIELINALVRICELVLKFSEYCRNIQRASEESIREFFFYLFCLMIMFIHYFY